MTQKVIGENEAECISEGGVRKSVDKPDRRTSLYSGVMAFEAPDQLAYQPCVL
jgi:hypothetical protein